MNGNPSANKDDKTRTEVHRQLLEKAMQNPGVKEVMDAYGASREIADYLLAQERLLEPQSEVTASDCTHE